VNCFMLSDLFDNKMLYKFLFKNKRVKANTLQLGVMIRVLNFYLKIFCDFKFILISIYSF